MNLGGTSYTSPKCLIKRSRTRVTRPSELGSWLATQELPALGLELLQVRHRFRFDVAPDERFGAAGAKRYPFIPGQEKLVTVCRDQFLYFEWPDLVESGGFFGWHSRGYAC